jgi:hypothetical protein
VALLALPRGAAPGTPLTYTQFVADVGTGTVRAVTISPAGQVAGSLAGGQPFTTTIPVALGGNGLAGDLAAHHVQVSATTATSSSLLSLLRAGRRRGYPSTMTIRAGRRRPAMRTVDQVWRSAGLVAQRGEQPLEVLSAWAACLQVRGDAEVALPGRLTRRHQLGIDVQHLHGLGASHVARIGPQETVQC